MAEGPLPDDLVAAALLARSAAPRACPACRAQAPAEARFCSACGASLGPPGTCTACGARLGPHFCTGCGRRA